MRLMVLGTHVFCLSVALALTVDSGSNNVAKMLDNGDKSAIIHRIQRSYLKTGASCYSDDQCESGVCNKNKCQAPTCRDNVKNQDETDIDCGGTHCGPCANRKKCCFASECISKVCTRGICQVPTCHDIVKNEDETDVDCGGTRCAPCAYLKNCSIASDCVSGVCNGSICQVPTCHDIVKNEDETDVDCGGTHCAPCADLKNCSIASDCVSGVCNGSICQVPICHDIVKNEDETDVDCGGTHCAPCADLKNCSAASDCISGVCTSRICQMPTCYDNVTNGNETDVDCGGGTCTPCGNLKNCSVASDCVSEVCPSGICRTFFYGILQQFDPLLLDQRWSLCYETTYDTDLSQSLVASILANCSGSKLLLGCRPTGTTVLTLAAMGNRTDVLYDCGNQLVCSQVGNGVAWYFSDTYSWGFFDPVDTVNRYQCDIGSGGNEAERLCWHTGLSVGGFRCGATEFLNYDPTWERVIYQSP